MVQLRYIVTGTGRSGTVGLAAALTSGGIPCSHERFFNGNSLDEALRLMESNGGENSICSQHCGLPGHTDLVIAESSYMAAPYLDAPYFDDATIIHAVRDPWKVILSFLNNIQFFRGEPEHEHELFVYSVLPQLHEIDNPVDRAVYYYIRWNRMIETLGQKRRRGSYIFHRIEDDSASLLRRLGLTKEFFGRIQKENETNSFKEWPKELRYLVPAWQVQIEHINASYYAAELHRLTKRYGYETPISEEAPAESATTFAAPRGEHDARFAPKPRMLQSGYRGYNLVRWRSACYALLQGEKIDLEVATDEQLKEKSDSGAIVLDRCLSKLKAKVDEISNTRVESAGRGRPILMESGYRCYNLVLWGREYYALHQQRLNGLDLESAATRVLKEALNQGYLITAPSLREAKMKIDQLVRKHPGLECGQP